MVQGTDRSWAFPGDALGWMLDLSFRCGTWEEVMHFNLMRHLFSYEGIATTFQTLMTLHLDAGDTLIQLMTAFSVFMNILHV